MTSPIFARILLGPAFLTLAACAASPGTSDQHPAADAAPAARYDFVRNATARLDYAGRTFLLDPMLSAKGELPSFAGVSPNPTVGLPVSADSLVAGIDGVIIGHMHADHFDAAAAELLPKDTPLLVPANSAPVNPADPSTDQDFKSRL